MTSCAAPAAPWSRSSTTAPERFAIRRSLPARTGRTAPHRHNEDAVERFTLIEGAATGTVAGEKRHLRPGDVMEIPRGAAHVHPHTGRNATAVARRRPAGRDARLARDQLTPVNSTRRSSMRAIVRAQTRRGRNLSARRCSSAAA
jgi:mannose-6-phosphate isomerase-like protein (cupin superfamily)